MMAGQYYSEKSRNTSRFFRLNYIAVSVGCGLFMFLFTVARTCNAQPIVCDVDLVIRDQPESIEDSDDGVDILVSLPSPPNPPKRWKVEARVSSTLTQGTVKLRASLPDGIKLYNQETGGTEALGNDRQWNASAGSKTFWLEASKPTEPAKMRLVLLGSGGEISDFATYYASCAQSVGESRVQISSLHYSLGLGKGNYGDPAGMLRIRSEYPRSELSTPAALEVTAQDDVTITTNGTTGYIELIEADQCQIEVNVINGTKYEMVIKDYDVPANEIKTIVVESPGGDVNKLYISEEGGADRVWQFEWSTLDDAWTLAEGSFDGQNTNIARKTTHKEEWTSASIRTETITVKDGNDVVTSKTVETYRVFPWGDELIKSVEDPDGDALTQTWKYYSNAGSDGDNYAKLKLFTTDTGYWEWYEYGSDGEISKRVSQYESELYQDTNPTALEAANIVTTYTRETDDYFHEYRNQTISADLETTAVSDRGTAVSKRYRIEWSGTVTLDGIDCTEAWDIDGASGTGNWNSAGNMVTRTWTITAGEDHAGREKQSQTPDGVLTIHEYTTSSDPDAGDTVTQRGFTDDPDATVPKIIYGDSMLSRVDSLGNAVLTYTERTVDGTNWFGVSLAKVTDTDSMGRPTETSFYFGSEAEDEFDTPSSGTAAYTSTSSYSSCCSADGRTDRNGITTRFARDEFGRVTETTQEFEDGVNTQVFAGTQQDYGPNGEVIETRRLKNHNPTSSSDWETTEVTTYDKAGRVTSVKDAANKYTFYTYQRVLGDGTTYDPQAHTIENDGPIFDETREYPHDRGAGPIRVTWTDHHGRTGRVFTATVTSGNDWDGSAPTVTPLADLDEEFSRTAYFYDWADRVTKVRTYFDLGTLGLDDAGVKNTHYYESVNEYDDLGRLYRTTDPMENITETAYDTQGRVKEQSQGTSSGMTVVSKTYYDLNYDRSGTDFRPYVTRADRIKPIGTLAGNSNDYTTIEFTVSEAQSGTTSWTKPEVGPWTKEVMDEQGRVVTSELYDHSGSTLGDLLAKTENFYDDEENGPYEDILENGSTPTGLLLATRMYEVSSGSAGSYLETLYTYDFAGRQVKVERSGGGFTKTEFDERGRVARTVFASYEGTGMSSQYSIGSDGFVDFTGDDILTQTEFTYDDVDNVTLTTQYELEHDATAYSSSNARITYQATWYDDAHRPIHTADYGTNGDTALTDYDPDTAGTQTYANGPFDPSGSDLMIVTKTAYDLAGRVDEIMDNMGKVTKTFYDDMGRQLYVVENYDDFVPTNESTAGDSSSDDVDRVTKYAYNAASRVTEQTALNPDNSTGTSDNQTTTYTYGGDNGTDSPVRRKDLLVTVTYPDTTGGNNTVTMTYMADGSMASRTDQRAVELVYAYDNAGRRISQKVDSGSVSGDQLVEYDYDGLDRLEFITAYDDKAGGTPNITSQVQYVYNGLGQVIYEYQQHGDEVEDTNSPLSPRIAYTYEPAVSGVFTKASRLAKITYPNGRVIHRVYDGHENSEDDSIDDAIGRANKLAEDDGTGDPGDTIVEYSYLGSGRVVRKDYPTPDVYLDYWGGTTGTYDGLDDFGRITAQRWIDYSGTPADVFHVKHGYDAAGNRRYADRQVYPSHSQYYTYDGLNRLSDYKAGKTNYNTTPDPDVPQGIESYWTLNSRSYGLDQLGNQLNIDTPEATAYYTNSIDAGEANEYASRKVKSNVGKRPVAEDQFLADTTANWVNAAEEANGTTSDDFDVNTTYTNYLTITGVAADTFGSYTEAQARTIVLLGEDVGPSHISASVTIPTAGASTAVAGIVFGYKSPNDYWVKAVDRPNEGVAIYHIVNGAATLIGFEDGDVGQNPLSLQLSGRRGSDAVEPAQNITNGFPSGRVGLFSNTADTKFNYFIAHPNETSTDLAGRWINLARKDGSDGNAITSANRLKLNRSTAQEDLPILLDGVRMVQFEATFSVRQPTGSGWFEFVFNATDQADYDLVRLRHAATAPIGQEVIDGATNQTVTPTSTATGPTAISTDVVWYRVKYDGSSLTVKRLKQTATPTEGDWTSATTTYASNNFDMSGGMIGFKPGYASSVLIDDLIVKANRDSTWVTEHEDDFDISSGYAELDPAYDAAGNLEYDGKHAYTYDAWNRLVKVTKAYTDGSGGYDEGSVVATMAYDGLGRRIEKNVQNSADMDCDYHYYHDGQSVVQIDNGQSQMLKQYVWGLQYIDELCQIALNIDPANAADPTYPENIAERFYYALQDANFNNLGIVNHAGRLIERYEYTPYGQRTVYSHGDILADIDGDGFVGLNDLTAVIGTYWNQSSDAAQVADLNGDGYVDGDDQAIVTPGAWNKSAPSSDPLVTYPTLHSARQLKYVGAGSDPGTPLCEVGHQGLFHDEEFGDRGGLIHNRARTLSMGRFMQRDPLGYVDRMSLYEYVRSAPVALTDSAGTYPGLPGHGNAVTPEESVRIVRQHVVISNKEWRKVFDEFMDRGDIDNAARVYALRTYKALITLTNHQTMGFGQHNRFVYTCEHGWIDMGHFWNNAKYTYLEGSRFVAWGGSALTEGIQFFWPDSTSTGQSFNSPEDYISNRLGRDFAMQLIKEEFPPGRSTHIVIATDERGEAYIQRRAIFANIDKDWDYFVVRSGAVDWSANVTSGTTVEEILRQDIDDFRNEMLTNGRGRNNKLTENRAREWYRQRLAYLCLCDGDKPKPGLNYSK